MATRKFARNRKYVIILVSFVIILASFITVVNATEITITNSQGFNYTAYANITKYNDRSIFENRIIQNMWYNGPMNTMVKTGGWYLGFVRQGTTHVSPGDYGVMQLYRSVDNAITWNQISPGLFPLSVTNRDVRNYAVGETPSGRIIVIYTVYDTDNSTYPELLTKYDSLEYIYSDDNGISWSGRNNITLPTIDYFTPIGASPFGTIKAINNGEIGFAYHPWNDENSTQIRFAYSGDDGITWNHSVMGSIIQEFNRTEADFVYLGNSRLMALARKEASDGPEMYTSTDNGRNWTSRGTMGMRFAAGTSASLALVTDDQGDTWVFAMYYRGANFDYSFGYGNDLMSVGRSAWNEAVHANQDINVGAFPVFSIQNNVGFMMVSQEESINTAFVLIYNITLAINQWEIESIWYGFIWLFMVFIPPIAMAQAIPKIGFSFGMVIILCILAGTQTNFLPIALMGITSVGVMVYKSRG